VGVPFDIHFGCYFKSLGVTVVIVPDIFCVCLGLELTCNNHDPNSKKVASVNANIVGIARKIHTDHSV
jgi:hypothetical protein